MAAAGGGAPPPAPAACAACKYQRRRCAADCPLAPYFPHDQPRVFRNAHRLFGVSNILKTLDRAGPDPGRRHEAMQCVLYESQAWDLYPSAGCVPIIHGLQRRIQQAEHELRRVRAELQAYRLRVDAAVVVAQGGGRPPVHRPDDNLDGGAGARYSSAEAMSSSSSSPPALRPPPFQLQWTAAMGDEDAEGIAAAARAPVMYGGGDEQQMMIDGGNIAAVAPPPQTLPWTIQRPPQYEHPFLVNATTMLPQFHCQQQPIVVSTQLPELRDDMMNYFADGTNGENDEMPRESR
jgi:hypothetical protein